MIHSTKTLVAGLLLSSLCILGQNSEAAVVSGNPVEFPTSSIHGADFLLGQSFNIPTPTTVDGIGIIFKSSSGVSAQVGIYSDIAGSPDTLLAQTSTFSPAVGAVEVPLTSPTVMSGDIWFMAVYDENANIGEASGTASITTFYKSLSFGSTLPNSYGSGSSYLDNDFNYYLTGTTVPEPSTLALLACGLAGVVATRRRR